MPLFELMHCSFRNAKDNVVIVLLMCLRHNGRCTTTAVSLVWAHHEFSCAGDGPEHASLSQRYEERKWLLCSPSCETTTTFMEDLPCHDKSYAGEKGHCFSPAEDWHIFHIKTDAYLFCSVLRQQMQLFRTANCTSAKSLKSLEQRMWNTSVTNGFENTQPLPSNGLNLCSPSLPRQNKAKQKKQAPSWLDQVVPTQDPLAVCCLGTHFKVLQSMIVEYLWSAGLCWEINGYKACLVFMMFLNL